METNPWQAESLEDFTFICCPECVFKSKNAYTFESHALENHPNSTEFFKIVNTESNLKHEDEVNSDPIKLEASEYFESELIEEDYLDQEDIENARRESLKAVKVELEKPVRKKKVKKSKETKELSLFYTQCLVCFKVCENRSSKRKHIQEEHPIISCGDCKKTFEDSQLLQKHYWRHHRQAKCDQCNKVYTNKSVLTKHIKAIHTNKEEKNYKCDLCNYKTHAELYLYRHKLFCGKFICEHCSKEFKREVLLQNHIKFHHTDGGREFKGGKEFKNSEEQLECKICGGKFNTRSGYICHYKRVHGDYPPEYQDQPKFYCDQCGNFYKSQNDLTSHMKYVHTKEWKYSRQDRVKKILRECQHCQKKFSKAKSLTEHVKTVHEKVFNFHCPDCPKKFYHRGIFVVHRDLTHVKFNCDLCPKGNMNRFNLTKHKHEAHGIKPASVFDCDLCNKFFKFKNSLIYHKSKVHKV